MTVTATPVMTTEEMLALPENGVERWLVRGRMKEKPMTVRNRYHRRIMARVTYFLEAWLERQPEPRGSVLCGEAGVRLGRNPDTAVGVDVVYVSAEVVAQQTGDTTVIEGVPVLAAEILSPNDTPEEINDKLEAYLAAGVRVVWVIDPHDPGGLVFRPRQIAVVNVSEELSGGDELPGFRVAVEQLFV